MKRNIIVIGFLLFSLFEVTSCFAGELKPCEQVPESTIDNLFTNPSLDMTRQDWSQSVAFVKSCLKGNMICLVTHDFDSNQTRFIKSASVKELPKGGKREEVIMAGLQVYSKDGNACVLGMNLMVMAAPWLVEGWIPSKGKLAHFETEELQTRADFRNAFTPAQISAALQQAMTSKLQDLLRTATSKK